MWNSLMKIWHQLRGPWAPSRLGREGPMGLLWKAYMGLFPFPIELSSLHSSSYHSAAAPFPKFPLLSIPAGFPLPSWVWRWREVPGQEQGKAASPRGPWHRLHPEKVLQEPQLQVLRPGGQRLWLARRVRGATDARRVLSSDGRDWASVMRDQTCLKLLCSLCCKACLQSLLQGLFEANCQVIVCESSDFYISKVSLH